MQELQPDLSKGRGLVNIGSGIALFGRVVAGKSQLVMRCADATDVVIFTQP